jgi:adenylate cyclase
MTSTEEMEQELNSLREELQDMQLLYETTLEHSGSLEEDLFQQNQKIMELQSKMRKYLAPQLFEALMGGTESASAESHKRIRLTVYFSDVVGFSDMTDSMEPELLSYLLNSYLTRMTEIAVKYGGTVDKFIGDAVMVFFGAPEFTDDVDHARRCVAMAVEMRDALHVLRQGWVKRGIVNQLQVRAGVNTGYCTVGSFGSESRMDYTIIGGEVNLAARLQALAPPDHLYISAATRALLGESVVVEKVGTVTVKGIHTPVEVWDVIKMADGEGEEMQNQRVQLDALDVNPMDLSGPERDLLRQRLQQAIDALDSTPLFTSTLTRGDPS